MCLWLVESSFSLFLCCLSFCLMYFSTSLNRPTPNFLCSFSLILCLSSLLNGNCCWCSPFICRGQTIIQKGSESCMQSKHYCAMSALMQTSCFRFLFRMFLTFSMFWGLLHFKNFMKNLFFSRCMCRPIIFYLNLPKIPVLYSLSQLDTNK